MTAAEVLIETLIACDIDVVFGAGELGKRLAVDIAPHAARSKIRELV